MLVDSHCHLTDDRFAADRIEVLERAKASGVERVLAVASDRNDVERVVDLLDRWEGDEKDTSGLPRLWGTAGVHPHEAEAALEGDLDFIREQASSHSRVVAIGETGLDFFYHHSPREVQEELFRDHLGLAEELRLPVVVHSRNADELTATILRELGDRVQGVLHCYTGGEDLLRVALDAGWMISFTGIITFKKYDAQGLVRSIPRDRLMVETDAPYLAPVPHRGRRNEPSFVTRVAECLAEIRDEDLDEVSAYTTENAIRFFNLMP